MNGITLTDVKNVIIDGYETSKTFKKQYINIAAKSCEKNKIK